MSAKVKETVAAKKDAVGDPWKLQLQSPNLGCRKWGCNKWGLKGVWPPFPEIRRNRPFSPFFCLYRPFPEGAKSTWKIQKTEEKGLFPKISSDLLKPPSLKPPFVALQLIKQYNKNRGFAKGWIPKGWFWPMFPCTKNRMFAWYKNRNEGTFGCSPGTKNRTEGTFAKTTLFRNRPFVSSRKSPSCNSKALEPWSANRELRVSQRRGAVETAVKSGLTKAHEPWLWGNKKKTHRPWIGDGLSRELGTFNLQIRVFSIVHFMVYLGKN